MCGIAGFVNDKKNKNKIIKDMATRIAHRGPDAEGFYIDRNVALAHRRLAIIDLESGSQPIYNEDKSLVIVFNGEIYNYQSLKKDLEKKGHVFSTNSDTEVIIHAYEEWNEECTKKFRGMFAFAIWDVKTESLFIARDGFGIKPLYYAHFNDTFMFASEIKAFLDHPDFVKELNEEIISSYLCFNSVPTEETLFKGVFRLDPGHQLIFKNSAFEIEKFHTLTFSESGDFKDVVKEIDKAMKDSVEHHKIADVEVGSFLSSGVDSSYLVALAKPDKTYTVGFDNPLFDETKNAKELADKLGISNTSKKINKDEYLKAFPNMIYHMDEPIADPSATSIYFLSQLASKDVKVVMSGEGADEFFAGYNSYQEEVHMNAYMKIPFFIRRTASFLVSFFPDVRGFNFIYRRGLNLKDNYIGIGRVFRDKEAQKLLNVKNQIHTKDVVKPFYKEYEKNSRVVQRQVIDYYFWLVRDFLHLVDRNTMMFGLEARTPFLDNEVFKVASKLDTPNKINKKQTKIALRAAAKKVVPTNAHDKRKLGFPVPLREWIRTDEYYNEILSAFNSDASKKYFDNKKIIKLLNDHKDKKKDNYKKVWAVYTFIVWYNEFFKKEEKI